VPILGRKPKDCFDTFRDHLARLLSATVLADVLIHFDPVGSDAWIGFWRGEGLVAVPLETTFGTLFFWAAQHVEAERADKKTFKLKTLEYAYKLLPSDGATAKPLIRWEYKRSLTGGTHQCRHHVHHRSSIELPNGAGTMDFDRLHVATGYTTIEHVLRFLITDLGMIPPCGKRWPRVLDDSERVFREQFSTPL